MNDEKLKTIEQVKQFLEGSEGAKFKGISVGEISLDREGAGEVQVYTAQEIGKGGDKAIYREG